MKQMKKLASLILALAMVLGLAITASAASTTTYSITIDNSATGHTYEAYQIFTGDLSADESGNLVLSNIAWGSGVSEAGQAALGDAATVAEGLTEANVEAFAKQVAAYLTTPAGTATASPYVISGLSAGYYLVKDQDNSLSGDNDAYTSYILEVVEDTTVTPKSDVPTSQKKVKDTNDTDGTTTDWQDSADYDIGDSVPFQLTGTVADNYDDYTVYKFVFHDTESAGLTFDSSSVKVYVDGNLIETGYTVNTAPTDGCTFEVVFADLKQISAVHAGSVITVEYTSTLNEGAVLGSAGNPNTMHLEYSNNPNDEQGGETGETPDDTVIVFTYKVVVNKVDENEQPLSGAVFTLEKLNADGTWTAISTVETTPGTTFTFSGLDDGDYRLVETTTPTGYNSIEDIYFTVTADHDVLSDSPALNTLSGNVTTGEITFSADTTAGSLSTDVVNESGSTLPETGGVGTTVFYVIGSVLALGAAIVLITRRRMSNHTDK